MKVTLEDVLRMLPDYDNRRAIVARDGLASVDGFRIAVLVVCQCIFGIRICKDCPGCNHRGASGVFACQDLFGNNAYAEGGSSGRGDGIYISIEAQKSAGSLHGHAQVHIECLHQHSTIREVMEEVSRGGPILIKEYLRYKSHVCREEYEDLEDWESRRNNIECAWPEYRDSVALVSTRRYLHSDMDGTSWREKYLKEHVQSIQELKQHHVHTLNAKGARVPLTHCRRVDNPNKCRGDFPRTHWLIEKGVVLCKGIMQRMGMSLGGKKKTNLALCMAPGTKKTSTGHIPL